LIPLKVDLSDRDELKLCENCQRLDFRFIRNPKSKSQQAAAVITTGMPAAAADTEQQSLLLLLCHRVIHCCCQVIHDFLVQVMDPPII